MIARLPPHRVPPPERQCVECGRTTAGTVAPSGKTWPVCPPCYAASVAAQERRLRALAVALGAPDDALSGYAPAEQARALDALVRDMGNVAGIPEPEPPVVRLGQGAYVRDWPNRNGGAS